MSLAEMIAIHVEQLEHLRDEKKQLQKQMNANRQNTARCLAALKALQAKKEAESK